MGPADNVSHLVDLMHLAEAEESKQLTILQNQIKEIEFSWQLAVGKPEARADRENQRVIYGHWLVNSVVIRLYPQKCFS